MTLYEDDLGASCPCQNEAAVRLGRDRPFLATALFPGSPISAYKQSFRSADVSLHLPAAETNKPELFTPLVAALQ